MFNVTLEFKVRPTILVGNAKWKPNNTLLLSFEKKPSAEGLSKILKFLTDQDTSGQKVKITYYD